jgi:hypothetical protein
MKALEKLARIERLYKELKNENRSPATYRDDLDYCFIQCWSVQDWLKNDDDLIALYPNIRSMVNTHVDNDQFLKITFDIANKEKHLKLLPNRIRADGKISASHIGIQNSHHISASICNIKINLIHVDDLAEYDEKQEEQKQNEELNKKSIGTDNTSSCSTHITQEYFVTDDKGDTFNALEVLDKAIQSWKQFIATLKK